MKVQFETVENKDEELALIRATEKTEDIKTAINLLESEQDCISVIKDGETLLLHKSRIYYIESVDKKSYVYTRDECFETKLRLYELEESLGGFFARCAKALIVNLKKVKSVRTELGGRMGVLLINDERLVVARSYVKEIKGRLGL